MHRELWIHKGRVTLKEPERLPEGGDLGANLKSAYTAEKRKRNPYAKGYSLSGRDLPSFTQEMAIRGGCC